MTSDGDDDARWAEAQAILDGTPTESGQRRLRRVRRLRISLVVAVALAGMGIAVALGLVIGHRRMVSHSAEVPTLQQIVGLVISGLGVVLMIVGLVGQIRVNRRSGAVWPWRSPLGVLNRRQRKELLATVRGRRTVDGRRLPLARHLAGALAGQRVLLLGQVGMLMLFGGSWVAQPSAWRLGLFLFWTVAMGILGSLLVRESRRAQRFLDAHPAAGVEA